MKNQFLLISLLFMTLVGNSQNDEQLMERAFKFFGEDDFKTAIETCDQVIENDSTNFEAYELKANCRKNKSILKERWMFT